MPLYAPSIAISQQRLIGELESETAAIADTKLRGNVQAMLNTAHVRIRVLFAKPDIPRSDCAKGDNGGHDPARSSRPPR